MIDAAILALLGSGLLAILLDVFDTRSKPDTQDGDQDDRPRSDAQIVPVTELHRLIGNFDQNS